MTTAKPAVPVARDADAELEALFAAINDVILVLDAEGRYVKIAPTNPSLLYRPAAELLGKTLREVFDGAQAEQFMEYIRTALQTRTTVHFEYSLPSGGRVRPCRCSTRRSNPRPTGSWWWTWRGALSASTARSRSCGGSPTPSSRPRTAPKRSRSCWSSSRTPRDS